MIKNTLDRLEDISVCTGVNFSELVNIYTYKSVDYLWKDICANRQVQEDDVYSNRALDVIQQFYTRKHNYTENWIE